MDVKDYLIKINLICNEFRMRCDNCPLEALYCGYPGNRYDIEQTIEVVEKYKLQEEDPEKDEES